ncbi:MAG: Threonine--tRNA ligase [Gammaproteobacteria bacterium]|nr:Threonine--tRNA ligase [Gammaproteobacteria bacterium]
MSVDVTLKDGSVQSFDRPPFGLEIADNIGKSLAKKAVAIRVNGDLVDLTRPIERDAIVEIVTRDTREGLDLLRHDAAHVLAEAAKELFPETQVTIGPSVENGFYYDFARDAPFTPEELERMEERMREIVNRDEQIVREVWGRQEAIEYFRGIGEEYKTRIIEDLPRDEVITIYRQGDFVDLCRGPHLPSTGRLGKAFKLTKLAGAYWRGDSSNEMLQRVYGTAWSGEKELKAYLRQLEEAEKRDHRRLGKHLDLFHFQEEAPGSVFWHPKGWTAIQTLIRYMRAKVLESGYEEVNTPDMMDRSLWEASGHWEAFGENMFTSDTDKDRTLAMKPMNCPGAVQIFNNRLRSYRELPLRLAEFGKVHRFEPSGALLGLMRVRSFIQDDGHTFCTESQITGESKRFCQLVREVYRDLGFDDIHIKFADRPPKRVGDDSIWDTAEKALEEAAIATGLDYTLNPGEGAFYGPKLEFVLRDAIGRDWQCGTLQVDLNLPHRLGAYYIAEDSDKHTPVLLHRAVLGSFERFLGILLEHHAGALPFWLAPVQVMIATIVSDADDYALELAESLRLHGVRLDVDLRNEKISYKVREHSEMKVPVMLILGRSEAEERTVTVRRFGTKKQENLAFDDTVETLARAAGEAPRSAFRTNTP